MIFYLPAFIEGMAIGLSLIIAIGAQNAFVLKQAILQNHLFTMAITCTLIDSILIIIGVNSFGDFFTYNNLFLEFARWGGGVFLLGYSIKSFYASFKIRSLETNIDNKKLSLKEIIITLLAVSLLNPHSYIDTCVLIGSVGACLPQDERISFTLGAILSSSIWFFALSYGASFLKIFFEKPITWRILDFIIGCMMLMIAISLMRMKL